MAKMKWLISILLALAATVQAATVTRYVRTDGNDSNDGTADDAAHAWLTLNKAVNSSGVSGATAYVINVAAGTYNETNRLTMFTVSGIPVTLAGAGKATTIINNTPTAGQHAMRASNSVGATLTVSDLTFNGTVSGVPVVSLEHTTATTTFTNVAFGQPSAGEVIYNNPGSGTSAMVFTGCDFVRNAGTYPLRVNHGSGVTLTNCTCTESGSPSANAYFYASANFAGPLTMTGCTATCTASAGVILLAGGTPAVTLTNCTFTSASAGTCHLVNFGTAGAPTLTVSGGTYTRKGGSAFLLTYGGSASFSGSTLAEGASPGANSAISMPATNTATALTLTNTNITGSVGASLIDVLVPTCNVSITGGTLTQTGDDFTVEVHPASGTPTITIGAGTTIASSTKALIYAKQTGDITVTGTSTSPVVLTHTTNTGNNPIVRYAGVVGNVSLTRCTLAQTAAAYIFGDVAADALTAAIPSITLQDCTGTVGGIITKVAGVTQATNYGYTNKLIVARNVLTLNYSYSGGYSRSFFLGFEQDADPTLQTIDLAPYQSIVIDRNHFTYPLAESTHCLFLGMGANNARVTNNIFNASASTAQYGGIVVKAPGAVFENNRIYGHNYGMLVCGVGTSVRYNTILMKATAGGETYTSAAVNVDTCQDIDATGAVTPAGRALVPVVTDNILVNLGTRASYDFAVCYDADNGGAGYADPPAAWCPTVNRNVYWCNATNFARLLAHSETTVAALQAEWTAHLTSGDKAQDLNSILCNVSFLSTSPSSDKFLKTGLNSPARVSAILNVIPGAWQRGALVGVPEWLVPQPRER